MKTILKRILGVILILQFCPAFSLIICGFKHFGDAYFIGMIANIVLLSIAAFLFLLNWAFDFKLF